jgi:Protein of unknown function (DUF2452)
MSAESNGSSSGTSGTSGTSGSAGPREGVPVSPPTHPEKPVPMQAPAPLVAGRYTGPSAQAPYPLSRTAPAFSLVNVAREIEKADEQLATVTGGKLLLLAEQIRSLQARAEALLVRAKRDADLHRVRCAFEKRVGGTYHVYREPDGTEWFSLFAPEEWRTGAPTYVASYRLEADMSFTDLREIPRADSDEEMLRGLLGPAFGPR